MENELLTVHQNSGPGPEIDRKRGSSSHPTQYDGETTMRLIEANNQFSQTEVIGIISINCDGTILYSNNKAQQIFECSTLTGRTIHEFVPDNYFGTHTFKLKHTQMIKSFFSRPFAGGRMIDPGTILRAKLLSGKMLPLNVGLESKLDPLTGKPSIVVGYITEASAIIDHSKVEKMLARATLVILQQFIAQTFVSAISFIELDNIPSLHYGSVKDEATKLEICLHYSFYKLSTEDKGGQDYKMLLYILSTAATIAISVLPLYVNHLHDHDKDEDEEHVKWTKKHITKKVANAINDTQEYLSTVAMFRAKDVITITLVVTTLNLLLLYKLRTLPDEFGIKSLKTCKETVTQEKQISRILTVLGIIPFVYLILKFGPPWCLNRRRGQKKVAPVMLPRSHGARISSSAQPMMFDDDLGSFDETPPASPLASPIFGGNKIKKNVKHLPPLTDKVTTRATSVAARTSLEASKFDFEPSGFHSSSRSLSSNGGCPFINTNSNSSMNETIQEL